MTLDQLTIDNVFIGGERQPSIARVIWYWHWNKLKDANRANCAADLHLSQLLGYKVHYFTIEGDC